MTTYGAKARRAGKFWMIEIPELDGLTQARNIGEATLMAREWIASMTEQDIENVTVELSIGEIRAQDIDSALDRVLAARRAAKTAEVEAAQIAAGLAESLHRQNVPMREIATVMGISFQRVAQLIRH